MVLLMFFFVFAPAAERPSVPTTGCFFNGFLLCFNGVIVFVLLFFFNGFFMIFCVTEGPEAYGFCMVFEYVFFMVLACRWQPKMAPKKNNKKP